jgi:mxaD protein
MVHVEQSVTLDANASDVWAIVGNFDKLNDWHPAILTIESEDTEDGHQRAMTLLGGTKKLLERLDETDSEKLSYSYTMVDGPLPVKNFTGQISITPHEEEDCIVVWSGTFEPDGTTKEDASAVLQGYFSTGLNALKKHFVQKT